MDIFTALADPTRRKILELLARHGQLTATDIYEQFDATPPAISQHLKVLREAKLVKVQKRAQKRIYQVNPEAVLELEGWARQMRLLWDRRFDALDEVLKEQDEQVKGETE